MRYVIDIHLHSSHSRATSRDLTPETLHRWATLKGLTVVGTGDFTHPVWLEELKAKLEPAEEGLYRLKATNRSRVEQDLPGLCQGEVRFLLSVEISSIYKKNGRTRKIHNLVLMPSFEAVERLNKRLGEIGNLKSDGRPILGLDSRNLVEIALEACPDTLFIPAHIWTPHFALFGANSGFDSFEECFEDMAPHIFAVETGLSSDPPMNWRLSVLDRFAIISNSDAHSPPKLAREATCFDTDLSYPAILSALKDRDPAQLTGTLEFFPEEGKYHCDGHRACGVRWQPAETRNANGICPVCGKPVTVGVLHRVEVLADRPEGTRPESARPYESLIPLTEIIASSKGVGAASQKVVETYFMMLRSLGPELHVLRETPIEDISRCGEPLVAEGIQRMRAGEVEIAPGFDGEYGRIQVFREGEREHITGQQDIFKRQKSESGRSKGEIKKRVTGRRSRVRGPVSIDYGSGPLQDRRGASQDKADRKELTPEQGMALEAQEGPVVVVAGPGTGKTFVLTHRAVRLVREHEVSPSAMVAVTFTNRAAEEMTRRIRAMLPDHPCLNDLRVGTFHRLALDLLRKYSPEKERTLIDEGEARSLLAEVLKRGSYSVRLSEAWNSISRAKSGSRLREAFQNSDEIGSILRDYQNRLRTLQLRDYDDILIDAVALFESSPALLETVRQDIQHLLVDEFQDVNVVQYRMVRLLAGTGERLFVIGDPDQAIYGFRGADRRHFRRLSEDFPGTRTFRLETNRRSTGAILSVAQAVISEDPDRADLALRATRGAGARVRLISVPDEVAEGNIIVKEVVRQVGGTDLLGAGQGAGQGRSFGDFAVLFRTGRQTEALEEAFQREGIPYRIVGQKGFLDAESVRGVLTFLRCALWPEDDYRLRCALRLPPFDPGDKVVEVILSRFSAEGRNLYDAVRSASESLEGPAGERVRAFVRAVESYHARVRAEGPEQAVGAWCEAQGLSDDPDVRQLLSVCGRYASVETLIREVLLGEEADCERPGGATARTGEAVTLMTLHAAKGLEFPVVFIAGAEDGLLPFRDRDAELAEERRLLYVGVTRGQDEVILTAARRRRRYGQEVLAEASPFVRDLGEALIETERQERRRREAQLSLF